MQRPINDTLVSEELANRGYHCKIISSDHISDLKTEIENQYRQGSFDEAFYTKELADFDFNVADGFAGLRSLIIVAAPQPPVNVTFRLKGSPCRCTIPPTYSYKTDRQIEDLLRLQLQPEGFQVQKANIPWKLLAVHSGLAQYGKNNITYVNGMGSYHRLVAFISDYPVAEDHWRKPQVLKECDNCKACMKACPTGAIAADRFLIRAERCLTYHNEHKGTFPQWIKPAWHNCLVGCLYCQEACPVNKDVYQSVEEGPVFSEDETAVLLAGTPAIEAPRKVVQKLKKIGMAEYLPVLGRNLQVLHDQRN